MGANRRQIWSAGWPWTVRHAVTEKLYLRIMRMEQNPIREEKLARPASEWILNGE